jgi:hypothetical protein
VGSAESFDLGKFVDLLCSNDPEQNPVPIIPASLKTQVLRLWKHGQQSQELIWADSSCSTEMSDILPTDQAEAKVFAWLRLGPQIGSKCFEALHRCFPGSLPGDAIMARTAAALEPYGIDGTNVIYGQSICSDEINNEPGDLSQLMTTYFGNCFPMGGIGGAPYVGKTGFGAFSGHVPDDGHVVILFGPHIAVSEDGELGMYLRDGQCKHTSACGAVLAAYQQCKAGQLPFDVDDMQQSWLREKLQDRIAEIDQHETPMAALIHAAYEAIRDKLLSIVNIGFGTRKLVLIGGIQLNMPQPCVDHFLPLFFQMQSADQSPVDLLPEMLLSSLIEK